MLRHFVRWPVGLFYLIGGPLIHGYLISSNPAVYQALDANAWSLYRTLWQEIALPHLMPWVVLLIFIEFGMGVLMLSRRPRREALGHAGGALFNLLLVPFWFYNGISNVLLATVHTWLAASAHRDGSKSTSP